MKQKEPKKINQKIIKKFFNVLNSLDRTIAKRYNSKCQKQIFVERTISKWFKEKKIVWIEDQVIDFGDFSFSESISKKRKRYISITRIEYTLNWSLSDLTVYYYDAAEPTKVFQTMKMNHDRALDFEYFNSSKKEFKQIQNLFLYDEPEKVYTVRVWDNNTLKEETRKVEARNRKELVKKLEKLEGCIPSFGDCHLNYKLK